MKKFLTFSLAAISAFAGTGLNHRITINIPGQISIKQLLNILFPNYNILAIDQTSQKLLQDTISNLQYKNVPVNLILKQLEYKYNVFFNVNPKEKVINIKKYNVFRFYIPINGDISVSSIVNLGSGGGVVPSSNNASSVMNGGTTPQSQQNPQMQSSGNNSNNVSQQQSSSGSSGEGGSNSSGSTIVIKSAGIQKLIMVAKSLLKPGEKLYFDIKTGLLEIVCGPRTYEEIKELLMPILKIRNYQIKVTLRVVEFERTKTTATGISWNKFWNKVLNGVSLNAAFDMLKVSGGYGNINYTSIPKGQFPGQISINGNSISAFIGLLKQFGTVKTITEPSVILRNGETVILNNGNEITYISQTKVSTTDNGNSIEYIPSTVMNGFKLVLNANVNMVKGKPRITLFLAPILQNVVSIQQVGSTTNGMIDLPTINTKSISLFTDLKNGETIVIGGFKTMYNNKNNTGVPILSDIPIIGNLFSYKENSMIEKRILFIISAKLIKNQ